MADSVSEVRGGEWAFVSGFRGGSRGVEESLPHSREEVGVILYVFASERRSYVKGLGMRALGYADAWAGRVLSEFH